MSDYASRETDKQIAELEKRIKKEYARANKEVQAKLNDYLRRYAKKDKTKQAQVKEGKITQKEYEQWRVGQLAVGQRWRDMRDVLAADYALANKKAISMTKGFMPDAYASNHNYETFRIEKQSRLDTSYVLYGVETVERLMKVQPDLLPAAREGSRTAQRLQENKNLRWNRNKINSVMIQGILQGASITEISGNLQKVTRMNENAAIRSARTMMTGAQNSGRIDSMRRAEGLGLEIYKEWMATLDERTRESHRDLDGERVGVEEEFSNGLMYPGDPSGEPEETYNCRCTLVSQYGGRVSNFRDMSIRNDDKLGDMSYDTWKRSRAQSRKITYQKELSEKIRRQTILKDYAGKGFSDGSKKGIINLGLRYPYDLQFFAEKAIKTQTERELRKGIRSLEAEIKKHEGYLKDPYAKGVEFGKMSKREQDGTIRHWKHEIKIFKQQIKDREDELEGRKHE